MTQWLALAVRTGFLLQQYCPVQQLRLKAGSLTVSLPGSPLPDCAMGRSQSQPQIPSRPQLTLCPPQPPPPPPALNPQQGLLLGPLAVEPVSATAWLPEEPLPRKAISPQRSVNKYLQSPLTVPRENTNQTQQALDRPPQGCGEAPAVQGLAVC